MRTEFVELLQNKLEDFVGEILNDKQKRGENDVIGFENVQFKYLKGFLDGMCTALDCNYQKEGDYWVIRDGSKYVYAIWVNPAFRGHGYGAEMLEYAKTLSPKGLTLHVNVQNPKALCLYHKIGFKVGTLEGRADNCEFYWRVYMETKPGLKGHEAETMKYEYPPKKVVYDG